METPKKLLIFQEATFRARKMKKTKTNKLKNRLYFRKEVTNSLKQTKNLLRRNFLSLVKFL